MTAVPTARLGPAGPVLGVDGGHRDGATLENALRQALQAAGGPQPVLLCTHPARTGEAHHAASLEFALGTSVDAVKQMLVRSGAAVAGPQDEPPEGPQQYRAEAAEARAHLITRQGGRAILFAGQDLLRGRLTVADVLATSGIERVEPLGIDISPDTVIDTRNFIRPIFRNGILVLEVTPAAGGVVIPLELEHQHICGH